MYHIDPWTEQTRSSHYLVVLRRKQSYRYNSPVSDFKFTFQNRFSAFMYIITNTIGKFWILWLSYRFVPANLR